MAKRDQQLLQTERLTLGVLMAGVASLALSDFVSPIYWVLVAVLSGLRLIKGTAFSLTEMQASMVGWLGFLWVGLELILGRAWVVAFTDFLLILAAAVAIEAATARNHLHRLLVSLFLILAAAVLSDSVLYVLPLLAFMWLFWRAAACLYGSGESGQRLALHAWRYDVRSILLALLMTVVLFFLLPRFEFHSLLQPTQPRMATTGFSDQVQLGDFARDLDATVILRVEPLGNNLGNNPGSDSELSEADVQQFRKHMLGRYWRGVALGSYTGQGWKKIDEVTQQRWFAQDTIRFSKQNTQQSLPMAMYREASDHTFMLLPEGVEAIASPSSDMYWGDQGSLRFKKAPSRRLRIEASVGKRSAVLFGLREPVDEERNPQVPQAVADWVQEVTRASDAPKVRMRQLMSELKSWTYDLHAKIDEKAPVLSFLQQKMGHCELFATTLALAARSLGIPSRIVNGYSGGEWNDVGGFILIRQQHAHSWVEVWVDGVWQRMDPTPASRWQLSGVSLPALDHVWESIKLAWYRYVLEFQDSDRGQFFMWLLAWLKAYGWILMGAGLACVAVWSGARYALSRTKKSVDRWPLMDRWLEGHGVYRASHQPLREVSTPENIQKFAWQVFVKNWEKQVYGDAPRWNVWQLYRRLRALSACRC